MCSLRRTLGGDRRDPVLIRSTFLPFLCPSHQHRLFLLYTAAHHFIPFLVLEFSMRRVVLYCHSSSCILNFPLLEVQSSHSRPFQHLEGNHHYFKVLGPHFTKHMQPAVCNKTPWFQKEPAEVVRPLGCLLGEGSGACPTGRRPWCRPRMCWRDCVLAGMGMPQCPTIRARGGDCREGGVGICA